MAIMILQEEQDEENEEPILGLDSESEISDADDLDYVPRVSAEVLHGGRGIFG